MIYQLRQAVREVSSSDQEHPEPQLGEVGKYGFQVAT